MADEDSTSPFDTEGPPQATNHPVTEEERKVYEELMNRMIEGFPKIEDETQDTSGKPSVTEENVEEPPEDAKRSEALVEKSHAVDLTKIAMESLSKYAKLSENLGLFCWDPASDKSVWTKAVFRIMGLAAPPLEEDEFSGDISNISLLVERILPRHRLYVFQKIQETSAVKSTFEAVYPMFPSSFVEQNDMWVCCRGQWSKTGQFYGSIEITSDRLITTLRNQFYLNELCRPQARLNSQLRAFVMTMDEATRLFKLALLNMQFLAKEFVNTGTDDGAGLVGGPSMSDCSLSSIRAEAARVVEVPLEDALKIALKVLHRRYKASHTLQISLTDNIQRVKIPLLCFQRSVWIAGEIAVASSDDGSIIDLEAQLASHRCQPHPKRKLVGNDEPTLEDEESIDTLKTTRVHMWCVIVRYALFGGEQIKFDEDRFKALEGKNKISSWMRMLQYYLTLAEGRKLYEFDRIVIWFPLKE